MKIYTKAKYSDKMNERESRNLALTYRAACDSVVLLKNDGTLPLKDKMLALYGSGALKTVKGGTGSGEVNERRSVSIHDGLIDRGIAVMSREWLDDYEKAYEAAMQKFEKKQKLAVLNFKAGVNAMFANPPIPEGRKVNKKDVKHSGNGCCVYVVSRQAGEGGDRKLEAGDYYLTPTEIENIRFCAENYMRFVLIINSGAPIDLSFADKIPSINSILYISQLGTEGGHAVADILTGAAVPSGKLADSWAMNYRDIPYAMEYGALGKETENAYYKEGIFVGYRYYDSFGIEPRYPFGFGLGYSSFALSDYTISLDGTRVGCELSVKNTGKRHPGRETVQLYVSAPEGSINKELKRLAAFKKSAMLEAKKSERLSLGFDLRDIASYSEREAAYVLEKGDYIIKVGTSSRDCVNVAVIRLDSDAVISKHSNVCPLLSPFEELKAPEREREDISALPVLELKAADIKTVFMDYELKESCGDERAEKFVSSLTVEEMTDIVVGIGQYMEQPRFDLPGSVGNTTSKFWDRGLANVTLCDGPAGLRINRVSALYGNGKIKSVELPMAYFRYLPRFVTKKMVGDLDHATPLYQFTTAFPVASALAQSWDSELMHEIGLAILDEMREYGCTYWLAPAINIHRNPLCGRSFEYFSEDPCLTGKLAAALISGVQSEEGYYATAKHFACNNQEESRNNMSSNVSERAMREIYLRAFEICVREGGVKSVMSSYNRVNGVLTPTSYDLCTKVLRCEWGFDGLVMTDWLSTAGTKNADALALKAGNDLIMPGNPLAKKTVINGVKTGIISESELRRCCLRVVKQIMNSNIQREYIDNK